MDVGWISSSNFSNILKAIIIIKKHIDYQSNVLRSTLFALPALCIEVYSINNTAALLACYDAATTRQR